MDPKQEFLLRQTTRSQPKHSSSSMSLIPSDGGGGPTGPHRHRLRSKRRFSGAPRQQEDQTHTQQEVRPIATMSNVDELQLASRLGHHHGGGGQCHSEENKTSWRGCNSRRPAQQLPPSSRFLFGCNRINQSIAATCCHMYSASRRRNPRPSRLLRRLASWSPSGLLSRPIDCVPLRLVTTIVLYLMLVLAASATSSNQQQLGPTSTSDQSATSIQLPGPSLWFQQQQQQQLHRPPKSTAQLQDSPASQSSDLFGSRLASAASDARQSTPRAANREDAASPSAPGLDTAAATSDEDRVFMNRQGESASEPSRLRQARQPAPPAQQQQRPNSNLLMQQQRARQQLAGGAPPGGFANFPQQPPNNQDRGNQERFQRLRNNAGNFEQFPRPQQGNFGQQQQQPGGFVGAPQPRQQQPQVALGLPTLSAFDLSSLANLANNQPANGGQLAQNQQLQPTFRRIPPPPATPQQQQQQQNQRANQQPPVPQNPTFPLSSQFFDLPTNSGGRQPVPNAPPGAQSTELPFIRQVFRPASENTVAGGESPQSTTNNNNNLFPAPAPNDQLTSLTNQFPARAPTSSGRPTPPPLFVPSRQQTGSGPQQSGLRTRPLESGFSPIQPSRSAQESPSQAAAAAFFEPSQQRGNSQITRQQQQPGLRQQQVAPQQLGSQPAASEPQQQQQRKPPVRRPGQRPHVPAAGPSTGVGGPMAGRVSATNAVAAAAAAQPDVIRLAANAIQAANEGLAAVVAASSGAPQSQQLPPATLDSTATTATSATTAASSSSELPPTTTTASAAEAAAQTSRRAISLQTPRASAATNFFQTLTSAATSAPSSFSPALPINQAIGATGGRRRIPVRVNLGQGGRPLTTTPSLPTLTPTTQPTTSGGRRPLAPLLTTTQASTTTSTTQAAVRRPEIEEFYETIGGGSMSSPGGGGGPSTTTLIDGFGAPARLATTSSTTTTSTTSTTNTPLGSDPDKSLATTTDLYGSRLSGGGGGGGTSQQDSSQPPATETSSRFPASESIDRPRLAVARPQPEVPVNLPETPLATSETEAQRPPPPVAQQQPVMVPVTYMTTLTYLTTVLHGTHTLETSHETVEKSTRMATLNAQLMDQIEHRLPLIEPTATVSLSSRTKGRGTTLVNLKSAISAYNQELVEALGAAGNGGQPPAPPIQPTQVMVGVQPTVTASQSPTESQQQQQQTSNNANRQFQQLSFQRQGQAGKPQQRPSRTVDLKELAELKRQLYTEYVYSYTMRPVDQPDQVLATSVRSELVPGAGAMASADLASQLQAAAAASGESNLIDANGMLRLVTAGSQNGGAGDAAQINLGSTIGRNTPQTMTEVNMNVATYLKFDGISNVLVDVRPTARFGPGEQAPAPAVPQVSAAASPTGGLSAKSQLDTSFNVHMTLGNALEQLAQQSPQQTPALEPTSVTSGAVNAAGNAIKISETTAAAGNELLRTDSASPSGGGSATSAAAAAMAMAAAAGAAVAAAGDTGAGNQAAASASAVSSSSLARSQLRSRVASSRFRTLQPSRAAAAAVSASPVLTQASLSETAAPSISGLRQNLRPNKSRILRPSLLQRASSQQAASEISSSPIDSSSSSSSIVAPTTTRSSKPRFVVVTRTGQFGIRASAISSLAAASSSTTTGSGESPSPVVDPSSVSSAPTVRVSSRFSKPNRFRGPSQSITRLAAEQIPVSATSVIPQPPVAPSQQQQEATQQQPPVSESSRKVDAGQDQRLVPPPQAANSIKLDGSDSVVVTYFTTTTHTIPFELNSETVFTTIEETNSRIATERMSDLNSRFIEPTATTSLPVIEQTAAPSMQPPVTTTTSSATTTTTTTTSSSTPASQGSLTTSSPNEQTTTQQTSSTTTTTSGSEPSTSGATSLTNEQQQQNRPVIDPSFVTSLNTRTYFTTFTHFTTYSAGTGSQTVESSESTTSNVATETITETQPLSAQPPSSSQVVDPPADASSSVLQDSLPVTKTLLSTMTYYGTVYNGTQSSLTPILDVSTQVLTVSAGGDASTGLAYLNSNALGSSTATDQVAPTSVPSSTSLLAFDSSSLAPTPPLDSADKITRTKSMYTTLTHFITFYSGTKTQLSTIQEISPTVVTEYIDRTLFEQQQAEAASAGISSSSPVLLIVPSATVAEPEVASASPTTTSTTTSTTTEQPETSANNQVSSSAESTSGGDQSGQQTTTSRTTTSTTSTTSQPELGAVSVSTPERPASAENQQQGPSEAKVLASSGTSDQAATGDLSIESKQATNIIELSDLIASNSSQSGRVALAGNLGAAIKDIVQLLAGNKTTAEGVGSRAGPLARPPVNLDNLPASSPASGGEPTTQTEAAPATTTTTTSTTANPPARRQNGTPTRVFGNKQRTSANIELSGSINSPATTSSSSTTTNNSPPPAISFDDATTSSSGLGQRATPELPQAHQTSQQVNQRQAATIFFGDDSGDERKKQVKTVWPGVQSTVFVTSVEPSTRSLTVTTTKVYYTRDAPMTVTSSYTSVIAPRTFVSTIMGTRTLVNQLGGGSTQTALPANPAPAVAQPPRAADTQNAAVATRYKQQKQQQQQVATDQRKVNLELQAKQKQAELAKVAARTKLEQQQQQAAAMIAQCQPACKQSANEVCKFTPSLTEGGGVGTFACACRPGYYMSLNAVGQRACQEVQSYVVMLRLLQIGNEQVAYKRELQNRASPEFKQVAKIVREHVKRAYMTSDLIRDRFVGADILNFARTLSVSSGTASQSLGAQPNSGRAPLAINSSLLDPLNAGVIVNMTIHLQQQSSLSSSLSQPGGIDLQTSQQTVDESMLKEELTKKLNMRQAAALAAAAAQAASVGVAGEQAANTTTSSAGQTNNNTQADQPAAGANTGNGNQTSAHSEVESLPNPNALFLADVEHVQDLDECASPSLNDCHEGAVCLNEPGSYRCDCREYPDLNPLQPGRQCAHELKSCDFCHNRGDCLRVPSLLSGAANSSSSSSNQHPLQPGNGRGQSFSTVCQCHRLFMGRHCEINGLLLSTLLPIVAILLIISVSLIIFCCRRWRRRSSLSKGFRNIGSFGPNIIGSTLDRKAMLESSSESSDTHQRHAHHHAHQAAAAAGHHHLNPHASPHGHVAAQLHHPPSAHLLRPGGGGGGGGGLYDASEPSSSQESSPRQMSRGQLVDAGGPSQGSSLNPYHNSIPPQIVIPRARHNQVNYAVHRGQVYMW